MERWESLENEVQKAFRGNLDSQDSQEGLELQAHKVSVNRGRVKIRPYISRPGLHLVLFELNLSTKMELELGEQVAV